MKQASRRTQAFVGGFVIAALASLASVVMLMGNDLKIFRKKTLFHVVFVDANGLGVGAPVKLGGVEVGKVDGIDAEVKEDMPRIRATLTVYAPFESVVREGTKVQLDTQGVLGDKFVMIVPGPKGAPRLAEGTNIPADENSGFQAVVSRSGDIVENINAVTARLKTFADGLPDPRVITSIAKNIERSSEELKIAMTALNGPDSVLRSVSGPQTKLKITATLDNLQKASEHIVSVSTKIDEGRGTVGALLNDASLYDDMKGLLGRANRNRAVKYIIQKTLSGAEDDTPKAEKPTTPSAP